MMLTFQPSAIWRLWPRPAPTGLRIVVAVGFTYDPDEKLVRVITRDGSQKCATPIGAAGRGDPRRRGCAG